MTSRGMWQAGMGRTLVETHLPLVLSLLLLMFWTPQNLVQIGWYFILMFITSIWQLIWPAYRLKRFSASAWVQIRYWFLFLLAFSTIQLVLGEAVEWLFFRNMMGRMYPELYEFFMEDPESISKELTYLISFGISFLIIVGNRLVFWGWFRFLKWTRKRLVRQFTLSHIMMMVLLFWLSAVVWMVYQVTWGMPKNLGGVNEAKEVAAWTGPLLEKKTSDEDLQRWVKQVEEGNGPSLLWYFKDLSKERKWRLYDRKGERVAGDPTHRAKSAEEELVRKSLKGGAARSVNLDASTYLATAPVRDGQYRIVGAAVLEKKVEPVFQLSTIFFIFYLFLAVSFGGVFLFLIVAMLIASFFAYLRARVLTRRFEKVAKAASQWSKGNLNHRIETDWPDELGTLSEQLNQVAASLQDVTRKLEEEKGQVETVLRQKKKFVADVSHELRTPVAILQGYLETEEKRREGFRGELDRLQQMIDQLFALSTQDEQEDHERFQMEVIHLCRLLQEVYETFHSIAWREKKISLGLSLPEGEQRITGDPVRLRQILHNLLRNAIRHTPEGGLVNLSVTEEADRVRIKVADTGPGMEEEEVTHVFQRYYRGRVAAGEYEGAGIGLALVKEWSERMGAEVSIHSEKGEGTEVVLTFAVTDERTDTEMGLEKDG